VDAEPTATAVNDGPVCYDATSMSVNETGGDAVSWSWTSDGSATIMNATDQNPTISGFVDGEVFTVVITDANGCTSSASTTITVDTEPTATAENDGPVCYDATSMSVNETGGDAVSWSWTSDGSATITNATDQTPTISGFVDGEVFTVVITDANGCTSSASTTITVDAEPTATAVNDGPVCYDATSMSVNETGGDAVSWSWTSDGSATITNATDQNPTISGFVDGEVFTVVITDANGCTSSASTTISINSEPTAAAAYVGSICFAPVITLTETGGDAVSWSWSSDGSAVITNPTDQNPIVTNFTNGEIYTVTITDVNGCTSTATVDGTEICPCELTTSVISTEADCNQSDATATVTVEGGTAPYTYMWSTGGTMATETGLAAGSYTVTVTDVTGCSAVAVATIVEFRDCDPECDLTVNVEGSDVTCAGNDGIATANVITGSGNYTYQWNTGATTNSINGLSEGTYRVTVTDLISPNCIEILTVIIEDGCGDPCDITLELSSKQ
jgi:hypothetical protein